MNGPGEQLSIDDIVGTIRIGAGEARTVTGSPSPAPAVIEVARLRADGLGWTAVARSLNARRVPTPSGQGQWWPSSARRHGDDGQRASWAAYMREYRRTHAYR